MASLGAYELLWANAAATSSADSGTVRRRCVAERDESLLPDQFVFASRTEQLEAPKLRRVRSVQNLMHVISGGDSLGAGRLAVAAIALLGGNLIATGHWGLLLACSVCAALVAVKEWRSAAFALFGLVSWPLLRAIYRGLDVNWLVTQTAVVTLALATLAIVLHCVQEDPRSYAMLRTKRDAKAFIQNDCCMDVKLLVFDIDDVVRMVPQGGLLGGYHIPRGKEICIGEEPPYIVKVYAPFEKELGVFSVLGGHFSLRATAPSVLLHPIPKWLNDQDASAARVFTNNAEIAVEIASPSRDCWTNSLWLPLAPLFASLRWGTSTILPGATHLLPPGPCVVRVYKKGLFSPLRELASCVATPDEGVEYLGGISWTCPRSNVRRSCSSILETIH